MYSLACRGQGPKPEKFKKLHPKFNISISSSIFGMVITLFFMVLWMISFETTFNHLIIMDEISIAFLYSSYIFVYIWIIKNCKDLNIFSRYIMPTLAIIASGFLVFAATGLFSLIVLNNISRVYSFLVFIVIAVISLIIGLMFYREKPNQN
jgi:APA family basic amino acid/polyamine antiporter